MPLTKEKPVRGVSKRAILSYVFDYAIIVILLGGFLALDAIEPYHQEFSLQNYTLHYKFAVHERVPNMALVAIAVAGPMAIICIYTLVVDGLFSHRINGLKKKYTIKDRLWELNCGLLGLGLAIAMQYVIVGSLKNAIGKPRPDLIDRCQPTPGTIDPPPFSLSNHSICTQKNNAILKDGFRSFPSGHSSTAFGGLFYTSLYLAGKLHVLDSRGEVWKMFVVLTPSLGASLVAGSRIMDARHHPFDVLSGSLIGIVIAWTAYRQYFPAVSNYKAKGRAYPMRTWGRESLSRRSTDDYDYKQRVATDDEIVASSGTQYGDHIQLIQRSNDINPPPSPHRRPVPQAGATIIPVGPSQIRSRRDNEWATGDSDRESMEYEMQPTSPLADPRPLPQSLSAGRYVQSNAEDIRHQRSMSAKVQQIGHQDPVTAGASTNVSTGSPPHRPDEKEASLLT